MSETVIIKEPIAKTAMPRHPAGPLMNLIVILLSPMFLGVSGGDISYARMAAIETLNGYRNRHPVELIAGAQIIAFGLAALGSLSLSMADDLSLTMTLRLRSNANACNRSAEQNRRALRQSQEAGTEWYHAAGQPSAPEYDTMPEPILTEAAEQALAAESLARLREPEPPASSIPLPTPAPATSTEKRHQEMWAIAMVKEASEIHDSIPNLPQAERHAATLRATLLSEAAHEMLYGNAGAAKPPRDNDTTQGPPA